MDESQTFKQVKLVKNLKLILTQNFLNKKDQLWVFV